MFKIIAVGGMLWRSTQVKVALSSLEKFRRDNHLGNRQPMGIVEASALLLLWKRYSKERDMTCVTSSTSPLDMIVESPEIAKMFKRCTRWFLDREKCRKRYRKRRIPRTPTKQYLWLTLEFPDCYGEWTMDDPWVVHGLLWLSFRCK